MNGAKKKVYEDFFYRKEEEEENTHWSSSLSLNFSTHSIIYKIYILEWADVSCVCYKDSSVLCEYIAAFFSLNG